MLNILITGATGFIGSKFVNSIDKSKFNIQLISRSPVNGFNTTICDFYKDPIPIHIFEGIDTIFHLAGYAHNNKNKKSAYNNDIINFKVTQKLVAIAKANKVRKFIYLSSTKASKNISIKNNQSEIDFFQPEESYGISKLQAENSIINNCNKSLMKYSILRPTLVYGPNVKGNLKKMKLAINNGWFPPPPIKVKNKKSMVHVDDVVRALNFVMLQEKANDEVFILTDSKSYSTRFIYEILCKSVNKVPSKIGFPLFIFNLLSKIPIINNKIKSLMTNEHYSSQKIFNIGFKTKHTLVDIDYSIY